MHKGIYNYIFPTSPDRSIKHELSFLEHNKRYKIVMNDIIQTNEQKAQTICHVVQNVLEDKKASGEQLIKLITIPDNGSNQTLKETRAAIFMDNVIDITDKLKFKDTNRQFTTFKAEVESLNTAEKVKELKQKAISFQDLVIKENPYYQTAVHNFVSSLDACSSQYVALLIDYSKISEILTTLSLGQKLALGIGMKLYVYTYYSMQKPEGITTFLVDVKECLSSPTQWNELPMKLYDTVYEKRYFILTSLSSFLIGTAVRTYSGEIKDIIIESSKYLPQSPFLRELYVNSRQGLGTLGYTLSSLITEFRVGFWNGLFENYKPKVQDVKDFAKISRDFIKEASKEIKDIKK